MITARSNIMKKVNRVAVILCSNTKKDTMCSVIEMYNDSVSFRARRIFVDYAYEEWYVNTSKYGFMEPSIVLKPYDSWYLDSKNVRTSGVDTQVLIDEMINDWLDLVWDSFPNRDNFVLDCHLSKAYYNKLKTIFPNINYIPQERVLNKTAWKYHDATLMMINGSTLEEALDFIGTKEKKQPRTETEKWFYHYDGTEYYGKSPLLAKQYQINDFNIWSVSMGDSNMTCGWVIDKSLLPHINKLPSGRYRMDKGYSKKNTNMERGDIKQHLDTLEQLINER